MLGASAGGRHDVEEMAHQSSELLNARLEEDEDEPQRAFNILAASDDDALAEAIVSQAAALLNRPLKFSLAIARVPVFHACALSIQTSTTGDLARLAGRLRSAPGLLLADDKNGFSLMDAAGQEAILVRPVMTQAGAGFWCLYDNARLAALCAVWIAETLVSVRQLN
jgi:aspartate-semialdehyde dehydrogenase